MGLKEGDMVNTGEAEKDRSERILGSITALSASLERAVQAIARDSVSELAAEIREQQMRCAELRLLLGRSAGLSAVGKLSGDDAVVSHRLMKAWQRLRARNREYAAVLEYSGRSLRALAAVHRQPGGYGGLLAMRDAGFVSGAGWRG